MGDRFYEQQNEHFNRARGQKRMPPEKPKRKLKKDIVAEIDNALKSSLKGLDKMTIADLEKLLTAILEK